MFVLCSHWLPTLCWIWLRIQARFRPKSLKPEPARGSLEADPAPRPRALPDWGQRVTRKTVAGNGNPTVFFAVSFLIAVLRVAAHGGPPFTA